MDIGGMEFFRRFSLALERACDETDMNLLKAYCTLRCRTFEGLFKIVCNKPGKIEATGSIY